MQTTPDRTRQTEDRASLDLDLLRYFSLLKQRGLVVFIIMLGALGLSAAIATLSPVTYEADAKLLVKVDRLSSLTGFGEGVGELDPLVNAQNPLSTELEIITSRPILEAVVERLNIRDGSGKPLPIVELQEGVEAKILGGADVIQISFRGEDPMAAAAVVNALADVYIENNIDENRSQATKALQLLEQQLPEKEFYVGKSEAALREFKEDNSIISLPDQAQSTVETLESLENQSVTVAADLREATARVDQLQRNLGLTVQQAMIISELSQSPAVQNTLQELQALERQRSVELGFYTEAGPTVQYYQAQIDSLSSLLAQEISLILTGNEQVSRRFWQIGDTQQAQIESFVEAETVRLSLSQRMEALESLLAAYRQRGSALPRLEQTYEQLERNLEVSRSSYQSLLSRLQELQTAESQVIENVRIIEPALVPQRSISNKKMILLAGGVGGAFLATAVVALLEAIAARKRQRRNSSMSI